MVEAVRKRACECEHVSHIDSTHLTPFGNPAHQYGQRFAEHHIVRVNTTMGIYYVCKDCEKDCHHPDHGYRKEEQ